MVIEGFGFKGPCCQDFIEVLPFAGKKKVFVSHIYPEADPQNYKKGDNSKL